MKGRLLGMEDGDTGRVRLADFYGDGGDGRPQFTEGIDFLRHVGALDESVPGSPRVIVSNYMNSGANCLASTGFYAVCCINECEAILGQIEAPAGAPAALAATAAGISSSTVSAPRSLSP